MTEQSYERTWFSERRPCRRNAEGQGNDSGFLHQSSLNWMDMVGKRQQFYQLDCIYNTGSGHWDVLQMHDHLHSKVLTTYILPILSHLAPADFSKLHHGFFLVWRVHSAKHNGINTLGCVNDQVDSSPSLPGEHSLPLTLQFASTVPFFSCLHFPFPEVFLPIMFSLAPTILFIQSSFHLNRWILLHFPFSTACKDFLLSVCVISIL